MKYGKLLESIFTSESSYIDYNYLKQQVNNENFIHILESAIFKFDENLKLKKKIQDYKYYIINYLSILKLLEKAAKAKSASL